MSFDPQFKQIEDFPGQGRQYAFAGAYKHRGFVGGGNDGSNTFNDFYEFDARYGTWTEKNAPGARTRAACAVTPSGLFIIGGHNGSAYISSVQVYDFATSIWGDRTAFPGGIRGDMTAVYCPTNGKIYAGLGQDAGAVYDTWYEYNPTTNAWTAKTACPFTGGGRYRAFGFCVGTKIYVGGGSTGEGAGAGRTEFGYYDVNTDTWTSLTALSTNLRSATPITIHDDLICIFGGESRLDTGFFHGWVGLSGLVLTPSGSGGSGSWVTLDTSVFPTLIQATYGIGHIGISVKGKVLICGGYSASIITSYFYPNSIYHKTTWIWGLDQGLRMKDPDTDEVTRVPVELPSQTASPLRIVNGSKVYGVSLVPVDSELASRFRIQTTNDGLQAIEKISED